MKKIFVLGFFLIFSLAFGIVPFVSAGEPGSSADDAMRIDGVWRFIQPKSSLWFYFDYSGDKTKIEIDLDDNLNVNEADRERAKNVEFALYTPQQIPDWKMDNAIQPIGRGSLPGPNSEATGHDLVWLGAFNFAGRFYILVKNNNSIPINFRLYVTGTAVTLFPVPTPTPLYPYLDNPFALPIPNVTAPGKFIFQEWSGGAIYTVDGDGSNLKSINFGFDPSWSPDGAQIVFSRWSEPSGLYVADPDGKNEVRVFNAPQILSPRWSPDGRRISFTRPLTIRSNQQTWKIGVLELNKPVPNNVEVLQNVLTEPPCTRGCFAPIWSSDNKTIVYADTGVGIMSTDTTTNTLTTLYNFNKVQSPVVHPDGIRIVFQMAQHDHWEIYVLNTADGTLTQVTRGDPLSFRVVNNVAPIWSPDGNLILFLSDRGGRWQFYVVKPDGTNLQQVLKPITDRVNIQYNFSNERPIDWIK